VADFVMRNTPKSVIKGLGVLENLQFPIHDKYSFECQIKDISTKADKDDKPIIEKIMGQFRVQDFPILSIENAFEKYWDICPPLPFPFPIPRFDIDISGDFREIPKVDACEDYQFIFVRRYHNSEAAFCACRTYLDNKNRKVDEMSSYYDGLASGFKVLAGRPCEL